MKLRLKILSGFLILSFMLLVAGIWSIYELSDVGQSVRGIIENNYKSITAAKKMQDALEREDSAILMHLLGSSDASISIFNSADSLFNASFTIAKNNITIDGEKEIINDIEQRHQKFKIEWMKIFTENFSMQSTSWYLENIHKLFQDTKFSINQLLTLNDNDLYKNALNVEDRSRRAIMPGIIAILSSIVFTLLFNYFINYYVISPILNITNNIQRFTSKGITYDYNPEAKDEIFKLSEAVRILASYIDADKLKK